MPEIDDNKWILLAKHFAGETSVAEEADISSWRSGNESLYQTIKNDWNFAGNMKKHFDTDRAWENVYRQLEGSGNPEISITSDLVSRKFLLPAWLKIAATVLFILAAAPALYMALSGKLTRINITVAENDAIREVNLPDGSTINLSSGSKIVYSRNYPDKGREIDLKGEAYFKVAADPSNPFIINVNGAVVKAVGTSFNVDEGDGERNVRVFVESGKVALSSAATGAGEVMLEPGYLGIMEGASVTAIRKNDRNEVAWMTRDMQFEDTRLSEVVQILEDVYRKEIVLSGDGLDTLRIFGEFTNDPLEHVLEVIITTNNLTAEEEDGRIILSGAR